MQTYSSFITISTLLAIGMLSASYVLSMMASVAVLNSRARKLEGEEPYCSSGKLPLMLKLLENSEFVVMTVQMGMFLSAFVAGGLVTHILETVNLSEVWNQVAPGNEYLVICMGLVLSLLVACVVVIAVQLARSYSYTHPEDTLLLLARPLWISVSIFQPCIFLLRGISRRLLTATGLKSVVDRSQAASAEEISEILEQSTEAGNIEEEEREMIEGVFEIAHTRISEVMTPRADVAAVSVDSSLEDIVDIFQQHGYSRVLVTGEVLDDVRGILLAKDLLDFVGKQVRDFDIRPLIREIYTVSAESTVDEVLSNFKRDAVQFAVVLDEHGGVDGVISFEDLVEEIVGDVFDEYDTPEDSCEVEKTKSGDLLVDGSAIIDDLNQTYRFNFPNGEYDTIAGFMIHQLGRIPGPGEELEYEGVRLKVEELAQNRITKLRIRNLDA